MPTDNPKTHKPEAKEIRVTAADTDRRPEIGTVKSVVLWEGPRARREAVYTPILDGHTGELHHNTLAIKTMEKGGGQWKADPKKSVTISDEEVDEIGTLIDFATACREGMWPAKGGKVLLIRAPSDRAAAEELKRALLSLSSSGRIDILTSLLRQVGETPGLVDALAERAASDPTAFSNAAAALKLAAYRRAVTDLERLIEASDREANFQRLLEQHPWMFGSEYSELLKRRHWTRDEQQDFMLRRTTDGYLEAIEIKTPLGGKHPFVYDASHRSYFPSADLSKVVGQVVNYIDRLEADQLRIRAEDGENACKIRAKIVIGRDGSPEQMRALRLYNAHLHRVEVLTFDQLLRVAKRVLAYLAEPLTTAEPWEDDIPY